MHEVAGAIALLLKERAPGRRLKVGVLYRGQVEVLRSLLDAGHEVLVLSDRFGPLWRLRRLSSRSNRRPALLAEVELPKLPLRPGGLDVVVLAGGLPRRPDSARLITALRSLLAPGGWLIAPHPSSQGPRGAAMRLRAAASPQRRLPLRGDELSALLLGAGYCDIVQQPVVHRLSSWIVSAGRVGKFFDRASEPVLFFPPDDR